MKTLVLRTEKLIFLFVVGNLLLNLTIHSQTTNAGIQYQIVLEEVTFSGNFDIKNDVDYTDMDYYAPPHWSVMYQPDEQKPIAYVSGQKPEVTAKFIFSCPTLPNSIYIKGDQPDGYHFEYKQVSPIPLGNDQYELIYPLTESVISFLLDRVDYFDDFVIDWKIGFDDPNAPYCPVSQSENRLYVTHKAPIPEWNSTSGISQGYYWFHTLLEISCREGKGESGVNLINGKIWNFLSNLDTKREDDVLLTYYSSWYPCLNFFTEDLLSSTDGQCSAWARFYIDLLKIQGIDNPSVSTLRAIIQATVENNSNAIIPDGFIVKDWVISPGSLISQLNFTPPQGYSFIGIPKYTTTLQLNDLANDFLKNDMFNWNYQSEVQDQSGISGQGVENPLSFFGNHQISKIGGTYFDPSYGAIYVSLEDMESKAIVGYYRTKIEMFDETDVNSPLFGIDLDGDGSNETESAMVEVIYFSDDLSNFKLYEHIVYDH